MLRKIKSNSSIVVSADNEDAAKTIALNLAKDGKVAFGEYDIEKKYTVTDCKEVY